MDETAIPILGKQVKPQEKTTPKTQQHQPQPKQDNLARYGEQTGTSIQRAIQPQTGTNGPTAVGDSDFASMFGWYVNQINIKMANSWYKQEVDPRTPEGRPGLSGFRDSQGREPRQFAVGPVKREPHARHSCQRAVQRVDTFGALPSAYNQSTLMVSYYCEY